MQRNRTLPGSNQNIVHGLTSRGYSRSFLQKALKVHHNNKPEKNDQPILPNIMNFSKSTANLIRIIKNNFNQGIQNTQILQ